MKLKHAILRVMDRDTLKTAIDELELDGVDRRSATDMAAALSRSHRATPEVLLEFLYEAQVKEVCELTGFPSTGRRRKLLQQLLRPSTRSPGAAKESRPKKKQATASKTTIQQAARPRDKEDSNMTEETSGRQALSQESSEAPVRLPEPPPGMTRVTKTELVWPGKYNDDGTLKEVPRVNLPFQVIERVNESRATREARKHPQQLSLFDVYQGEQATTFEDGWRNKLIWGENLLVTSSLLEQFAGKVNLIYIDPPFATGADFSFSTQVGDTDLEVTKEQSAIEDKAYRDTWGRGISSYLSMMYHRLVLMRDLLAEDGSIYVHCDWRVNSYIRMVLDEVFGSENFQNEVVWSYKSGGVSKSNFARKHDTLLLFSRSQSYTFNVQKERTYKYGGIGKSSLQEYFKDENGDEYCLVTQTDVFTDIGIISTHNKAERIGYPTQKPEALLERIIKASSNASDLVADFFCGSGTTLAVAERLGRRWIGCDLGRWAVHITRKRLLGIEGCKPFEVLNLGKYERQYWQGVTFGHAKDKHLTERCLYEYLAFLLRLYGAQPVPGLTHLHGKKGRALVHIGAVDAPVTIDEISQAINECIHLKQPELHVLGWEWEMGLAGPNNEYRRGGLMQDEARKKGVKLILMQIPHEAMEQQAVDKGDVQFFELAYLDLKIDKPKKLTARVKLTDFVIPNTELVPEEVRSKIKKWSDYIDYWAVDWDFQNDTFMQGWVAYRTRRDRTLTLTSDSHTYDKPGKYRILVKVIDIFGNDTSQAHNVEVK